MASPRVYSNKKSTKKRASVHRHYVQHDYEDHAHTTVAQAALVPQKKRRGGVAVHFPVRLHEALAAMERDGYAHVMGWQPHGRCFVIHKPRLLEDELLGRYFSQSKFPSFQRQLNLYGFQRLTRGPDGGGYYHALFLRGKPYLAHNMQRQTIKGTKIKAAANPDAEPNFYTMEPVYNVEEEAQALPPTCPPAMIVAAKGTTSNTATSPSVTVEPNEMTIYDDKEHDDDDSVQDENVCNASEKEQDAKKQPCDETVQKECLPGLMESQDFAILSTADCDPCTMDGTNSSSTSGVQKEATSGNNHTSQATAGSLSADSSSPPQSPPLSSTALRPPPALVPSWWWPTRAFDGKNAIAPSPRQVFAACDGGAGDQEAEDFVLDDLDLTMDFASDVELTDTLLGFLNEQGGHIENVMPTCL